MALRQTAGRGRQGRTWQSEPGNFLGSTLVQLRTADPSPPSLSLAAGLALIEAVDIGLPGSRLMLKWPNDLLLAGKKVAGILLERSGDRIVAGFGVNLASAPELPDRESAAFDGAIGPQAFAALLAGSFARLLDLWRHADPDALARAWMTRAHALGTALTVHASATERSTGTFAGVDADGALRLKKEDGSIQIIRAGDVSLGQ